MLSSGILGPGLLVLAGFALGVAVLELYRRRRGGSTPDACTYSQMLDALDDRVCRFGVDDHVITYCNRAWARSVGTSVKAAVGSRLDDHVSPRTVEGLTQLLRERGDDDGHSWRDTQLRHVDGRIVFEQWWDTVLPGADGRRELLCVGRDVTERALIESHLVDSERQHRELIEHLPMAAFVRHDRALVFANQAAANLVGLERPDELMQMGLDMLFDTESHEKMEERIARQARGEPVQAMVRAKGRTVAGDVRTVDIYSTPIDFDGKRCQLAVVNDVTDLVDATSEVIRSEERFRALADRSTDVIFRVVAGSHPHVEYVNQAFTTLTGMSVTELTESPVETVRALLGDREAKRFLEVITSVQGPRSFQLPITHLDGTRRWVDVRRTLSMGRDGSLVVDGSLRDVTAEKSLEETLRDLANIDELTGLANRRALEDELQRRLFTGDELSVLFLDLDRFKDVNDSLGHLMGDELLREIGHRLQRSCRIGDFVARLAGDEFIVVTGTEPEVVADRIRSELAMPLEVGESVLSAQASIGITRAVADDTAVSLLGRADAAMYEAKRSRGRRRPVL